jgi:hypothetical protein
MDLDSSRINPVYVTQRDYAHSCHYRVALPIHSSGRRFLVMDVVTIAQTSRQIVRHDMGITGIAPLHRRRRVCCGGLANAALFAVVAGQRAMATDARDE